MNANEQRIFDALLDKGEASPRELSTELGIGQRQMQRYLQKMGSRTLVQRVGYGKYKAVISADMLARAEKVKRAGKSD